MSNPCILVESQAGFSFLKSSPYLLPLCGGEAHHLWIAWCWGSKSPLSYGSLCDIAAGWLRSRNCTNAASPCKASTSRTLLHSKLGCCEWPHIWLPWFTLRLITLLYNYITLFVVLGTYSGVFVETSWVYSFVMRLTKGRFFWSHNFHHIKGKWEVGWIYISQTISSVFTGKSLSCLLRTWFP